MILAEVLVHSPSVVDDTIEVVPSTERYAVEGRALRWTLGGTGIPDLTGAVIYLDLRHATLRGVASMPLGNTRVVEVGFLESEIVLRWQQPFVLRAQLLDGHTIKLRTGNLKSLRAAKEETNSK